MPREKILVRGVNWLGDAVMSTPALQRLREAKPEAHIALLTHEKLAGLWRHHPCLDAVEAFSAGESVWAVARRLRRQRFDAALIFPNSPRSALETWLARIPQRVGYARPWRNWMLTAAVVPRSTEIPMRKRSIAEINRLIANPPPSPTPIPPSAHHIHQYLHLVAALGANPEPLPPRLVVRDDEVVVLANRFSIPHDDSARPCFGLNAGAEYGLAKRWPRERFIAAAIEIQRRVGCRWLILGGKADVSLAYEITSAVAQHAPSDARPVHLAGATTLRELCAVLKLCRVLLTNDTGPMHVAAALGTPVVVPFGSTSPELTAPGLPGDPRHRLLQAGAPCSPCYRRECPIDFRCMTGISVERVVEAVLQTLNR